MKKWLYKIFYHYYSSQRYRALKKIGFDECHNLVGGLEFTHYTSRKGTKNLVLLHGLLDASFGFRRIIPYLSDDWKIYIPDIPGFGKNTLPEISYLLHLDLFSSILYDWIKILNLSNITLVGHSMGGLIAQHIALKDSESLNLIKKLFLISSGTSPHPKREEIRAILFPKNRGEVLKLLHELYYKDFPDPSPLLQDVLVSIWNTRTMEILTQNTLEREEEIFFGQKAKNIKIPSYILVGKEDKITSPDMMRILQNWIEGSILEEIDYAKHALHLEHPQLVADFINRHGL